MNGLQNFSWRVVIFASAVATSVLACTILLPWVKIALAEAHAAKIDSIYSTGLLPCGAYAEADDLEAVIQTYQPGKVTLEIREYPLLSNEARVVQVAGQRIYAFEFKPLYKETKKLPPELNTEVPPRITVTDIPPEVSQQLSSLLAEDIRHAQPREQTVIDGVTYTFRIPGVGCAHTNCPSPDSRAGKLTELYHDLIEHVSEEDNQHILALVRALQVN